MNNNLYNIIVAFASAIVAIIYMRAILKDSRESMKKLNQHNREKKERRDSRTTSIQTEIPYKEQELV